MPSLILRSSVLLVAASTLCAPTFAQGAANNPHLRFSQEYHWTFSEIGDVGNAPYAVDKPGSIPDRPVGAVDRRYCIATTEVTWGQYLEFVQVYAPIAPSNIGNSLDTPGSPFRYIGTSGGVPQYEIHQPERLNAPASQSWRIWARFVNWLNAGGPDLANPASIHFENGAYDTSTFGRVEEGPYGVPYLTDQDEHTPGARFWIPSQDELTKATFYDPNKDGQGNGGYWQYGHSSDDLPIAGDPALGGETNGGLGDEYPSDQFRPLDVGSYPDVQSPWGLLDTTGGAQEWTETWSTEDQFLQGGRYINPAAAFEALAASDIDLLRERSPSTRVGLRLAMAVPAPSGAGVLALSALLAARRRR
ncbi:MAG: SUMF1/EgtB/PvdO family nonheme iron enzyme [Phycisphaerales bacterium]